MKQIGLITYIFAALATFNASAFELEFQKPTTKNTIIVNEITQILPTSFKDSLKRKIKIRYKNLSGGLAPKDLIDCSGLKSNKALAKINKLFGKSSIKTLYIDNVFKQIIEQDLGSLKSDCGEHKTLKTRLQSVILHELAHIYDFSNKKLNIEKDQYEECRKKVTIKKGPLRTGESRISGDRNCVSIVKNKSAVSGSPYFLNLAGWNKRGVVFKTRSQLNKAKARSVDPYEFKSSQEYFAVNFEFFLLDDEYVCRKPLMHQYYSQVFDHMPFSKNCQSNTLVTIPNTFGKNIKDMIVDLDIARLYQVHYFFAGEGDALMSRFGHAMFRLVFCAKDTPMGPGCLLDTHKHVIVNYRANVSDLSIDYIKGIRGKYDSRIYLMRYKQVVDEYTKGELRNVYSLPVNFSRQQKQDFLTRTLELYWFYKGKYYFFTNNCASEAINHMRTSFQEDLKTLQMQSLTPSGLYAKFAKNDLIDLSLLDDEKEAIQRSYFSPSYSKKLEFSYKQVLEIAGAQPFEDVRDFLLNSSLDQRKEIFEKISGTSEFSKMKKIKALTSLLRLEEFCFARIKINFTKKVTDLISEESPDKKYTEHPLYQKLFDYKVQVANLQPENLIKTGYGIPLLGEFQVPDHKVQNDIYAKLDELNEYVVEWALELFKEDIEHMKGSLEMNPLILDQIEANLI